MAVHAITGTPHKQKPSAPFTVGGAALNRLGGPEVLAIRESPVTTMDANEILIAVHSAGTPPWDANMRGSGPGGKPSIPPALQ